MYERAHRRLAAIVSTDVVGYSRLMGVDEAGTLARMKAHRQELWTPAIEKYGGRIVGTAGDALLIEFSSAVSAAESAIQVQQGMAEREAEQSEDTRMLLRIGINIGEVVVDGDDIFGDGVNVAARLQAIAPAGGICLSGKVYDEVDGKIAAAFEDAGVHEVKNIARPIQVWRWMSADVGVKKPQPVDGNTGLPLPDKPSIAVLPFDNMSSDPDQEFFADGMAEDLITALSRMPWFFVIARNSTFTYKGQAVDVKQVAATLGVRYVLEGSVRRAGNRLRITAQLIDASSGKHVWAERYDRQLADIFDVQDEVTQAIVGAIAPEFLAIEAKRTRDKDPDSLDAWECVMRGRVRLWKLARADAAAARSLFERAIELSPSGEFGASDLALVHYLEWYYGWGDSLEQSFATMLKYAELAVEVDDHDVWALVMLAWAKVFARQFDEARTTIDRAVTMSPSFAPAVGFRGSIMALSGEVEQALPHFREARRLSPRDRLRSLWLMGQFWAEYALADYAQALETAEEAIRLTPGNPTYLRQRAAALAMLGRLEEARRAIGDYLRVEPTHTLGDVARLSVKNPEHLANFLEGLRRAGLPE